MMKTMSPLASDCKSGLGGADTEKDGSFLKHILCCYRVKWMRLSDMFKVTPSTIKAYQTPLTALPRLGTKVDQ